MEEEPRTSGLLNLANNCYLNSVLQIFARIPTLREYLNTHTHSVDVHRPSCISCLLSGTFSDLWNGPSTPSFFPRDILAWLKDKGNGHRFTEFEQSDPYELIELLLENISLNPFRHEEISRTFCVACSNEDVEEFQASNLPGNGIRFNLNTMSGTSIQQILNQYKKSLSECMCHRCGEFEIKQREIISAPNVLMISLERNQIIDNQCVKNMSPCEVDPSVSITLKDGVTVKYKILGTIDHIGVSVSSGHYVATVSGSQNTIVYSDSLLQSGANSGGDVVLAFYLKEGAYTEEFAEHSETDALLFTEDELEQTIGCNTECSEIPSHQTLLDSTCIDPRVEINQKHLKTYVEAHATRDELQCLFKNRVLVIGLPKRDEMQESEESEESDFRERYESFLTHKRDLIYTITYKYSLFLTKILRDPELQLTYDFYEKVIAEKVGSENEHEWIAEVGLCFIMHTHMHSQGPRYEFFFQLTEQGVITRNIILYFENVKQRVIQKLPKLKTEPIFCLTSCKEDCFLKNDSYHYSLTEMKALEPYVNLHDYSRFPLWTFLDNEDRLKYHPLKDLLHPPETNEDEDIVETLTRHLNTVQIKDTRKWCVYILLVVKNSFMVPTIENLKQIWESGTATFGIYIGCTCHGRFRHKHLKTTDEGGSSVVSRFLDESSRVFLVASLPFRKKIDALNAEARLIGFLKFDKRMKIKNKKKLNYIILNVRTEFLPLRQNTAEQSAEYKKFMRSGQRLFRFIGEEVRPNWITEGTLQSYLVQELIY